MIDLYVEFNNNLIYVGYIKPFIYDGEELYKVERVGMFTEIYNKEQLKEFIKNSNFILKEEVEV